MRRALFPSEVAASTPIGLSVSRFPAPHTLAAFSIRPRIHFGRLPRLDCHITDCFHQHHYIVPHPSQRRLTAPTVQFSAGIVILCGVRREPPTSAGSDPATGGRWRCRTPRLSPRTVFKTGSEATRIHLPNILVRGIGHHHAMSLCRISLFVRFSASRQTPHLNAHSMRI